MNLHLRQHKFGVAALIIAVALVAAGCGCSPAPAKPRAEGSGCSGLTNTLPAGTWYGDVKRSSTTMKLSFDVVCFYVGPNATPAAIEDGENPNDTYEVHVRNRSAKIRNVPVCSGAKTSAPTVRRPGVNKTLSVSDYLLHVKGTLNDPDIFSYAGLTKLTVRANGDCASAIAQVYLA